MPWVPMVCAASRTWSAYSSILALVSGRTLHAMTSRSGISGVEERRPRGIAFRAARLAREKRGETVAAKPLEHGNADGVAEREHRFALAGFVEPEFGIALQVRVFARGHPADAIRSTPGFDERLARRSAARRA